jgi:hypothetical protein
MACSQSWPRLFARPGHEAGPTESAVKQRFLRKTTESRTTESRLSTKFQTHTKSRVEVARVYSLALLLFETRRPPGHNLVLSPAHCGFVMGSQGWECASGR